ncbi:FAD-dependent monooxygenase [Rhodococcus opacus]|uniref:FAD-dependent monooxygenase n=1 Tax=Rhodococcus opacus TaxID=37919 RepID=UPI0024B8361C|nr:MULTISPECIES: FAD-dependent monooxygenase [Rhodococcus]WKN59275.1 FAD-dependent monooxygenase [Rhodococcus opacus]
MADSVDKNTPTNYTWFTTHLVEGPWHRDQVVLIGDAIHNCPPTIAQGAAMALEDAAVLVEELLADDHTPLDQCSPASATADSTERRQWSTPPPNWCNG